MKAINLLNLLSDDNEYGISNIIVPKIQRSYAQGRLDSHATKTRERFLKHIREKVLSDMTLTLDFIYGNVSKNNCTPLDGQQRLTTLWLLHWYAACKGHKEEHLKLLSKFTYHTRYSARDFINKLMTFSPSFTVKPSAEIRNQGWFPMEWDNDPTVSSMLVMIDAIDEYFNDVEDLWEKLDRINFYFKNIEEMNLTDEIYIKMNSRGKPLTEFEHVKAEILKTIRANDITGNIDWEKLAARIGRKFDIDWTDLLWNYRGNDNSIDDKFLRYMLLIFHLLIYRNNKSVSEFSHMDYFDLINYFFTGPDALSNLEFFEKSFDCWVKISQECSISEFFNNYLSYKHEEGKSIPLERMDIDLFEACINGFPFGRQGLNARQWLTTLYAFMVYLFSYKTVDGIRERDFRRRIRVVLNLQKNSWNEVVDNPKGDAGNRMPAILKQVENIINEGIILQEVNIEGVNKPNFNVSQLKEEKEKLEFCISNPDIASTLFLFEDYNLINGRITVLGLERHDLYRKLIDLFDNNNHDLIDRTLLSIGDYWQGNRRKRWCLQLGSGNRDSSVGQKAWFELFHPSEYSTSFDQTQSAIIHLLENDIIDEAFLEKIVENYLRKCEEENRFPWKYYYIKYECFRIQRYGKYYQDPERSYQLMALWTEKKPSQNAYDCFLKAIGDNVDYWRLILSDDKYMENHEAAFVVYDNTEKEIARLDIPQNFDGIDAVDRIKYLLNSDFYKNFVRTQGPESNTAES